MKKLLLITVIISVTSSGFCQECLYMCFGYGIETYRKPGAMGTILTDFNDHMNANFTSVSDNFVFPGTTRGLVLAGRTESEAGGVGLFLNGHKYNTEASGVDASGEAYYRKLRVSHSGFSIVYSFYFVSSKSFRMGPGIGFNFEQFRCKIEDAERSWEGNSDMPIDKFYLSGSVRFPIVIGGEDFAIEITPYYQQPFYKLNLTDLNEDLNPGSSITYTKDEMKYSPRSVGICLTFNIGFDSL